MEHWVFVLQVVVKHLKQLTCPSTHFIISSRYNSNQTHDLGFGPLQAQCSTSCDQNTLCRSKRAHWSSQGWWTQMCSSMMHDICLFKTNTTIGIFSLPILDIRPGPHVPSFHSLLIRVVRSALGSVRVSEWWGSAEVSMSVAMRIIALLIAVSGVVKNFGIVIPTAPEPWRIVAAGREDFPYMLLWAIILHTSIVGCTLTQDFRQPRSPHRLAHTSDLYVG